MQMLITQALDERDLLAKKIKDAISGQEFVSYKLKKRDVDHNNCPVEKITEDIKSTYQSITDMMKRYCTIIQKIAESNAVTKITVDGQEMSISAAISILKDIKNGTYFEARLLTKLVSDSNNILTYMKRNDNTVDNNKQIMLNGILSKSDSKKATDEEIDAINKVNDGDYAELIDPLGILDKIKELKVRTSELQSKILSAIKISNATTVIEID